MKNEELYYQMSWAEMCARYPEMSKAQIEEQAQAQADLLMSEGEVDEFQAIAIIERNKTFWATISDKMREKIGELPEKNYKFWGCEFSKRNTGDRLDYAADPIYAQIQEQLKEREALLKAAFKSTKPIYDEHGAEVPKVPVKTFGKETLIVKF